MNAASRISVQVVLAWADRDWRCQLEFDGPVSAGRAIDESGVAKQVEGLDPWRHGVALFGRRILPEQLLRAGDRLEVLRPLRFDPMESRRRRAEHRKRQAAGKAATKTAKLKTNTVGLPTD